MSKEIMSNILMFIRNKNTLFLCKTCFFLWLLGFPCLLFSQQNSKQGADLLLLFRPGIGQNSGQSSEYFPKNVFGLPDSSARYEIPAVKPEEICSIGFGGEIIVGFQGKILRDKPGKDFTVFENSFYSPDFKKKFIEPAKVAVSKDGITYIEFPYDSQSLQGCAGITPTYGNKNPFDPNESGGDSFDLADIGIDSIRYIKITDISELLLDRKHPLYDPIVTGFDIDAVIGLHLEIDIPISIKLSERTLGFYSNSDCNYSIYSLDGRKILSSQNPVSNTELSLEYIPNGLFIFIVTTLDKQEKKVVTFIK